MGEVKRIHNYLVQAKAADRVRRLVCGEPPNYQPIRDMVSKIPGAIIEHISGDEVSIRMEKNMDRPDEHDGPAPMPQWCEATYRHSTAGVPIRCRLRAGHEAQGLKHADRLGGWEPESSQEDEPLLSGNPEAPKPIGILDASPEGYAFRYGALLGLLRTYLSYDAPTVDTPAGRDLVALVNSAAWVHPLPMPGKPAQCDAQDDECHASDSRACSVLWHARRAADLCPEEVRPGWYCALPYGHPLTNRGDDSAQPFHLTAADILLKLGR